MKSTDGAIALGAAGIVLLCAMDAVAKALGANLTTFQVVFVRCLGAAIWLALWIVLTRGDWPRRENLRRHLLRAIMLVVTASLFFYAIARLPLAVVAALGMTAPVYVTVLGAIIFKEHVGIGPWIALGLGAAGSAVIIFAGSPIDLEGATDLFAWAAAVLAPLSYAITLVILKHHSSNEGAAAMTLAQTLFAAIIISPLAFGPVSIPDAMVWGQIALIGFFGAVGFLLLINGLKRMPVSVFAVLDYTGLIWAGLFGFLFFGEIPGPQLWVGGALIVAACVITARSPRARPA